MATNTKKEFRYQGTDKKLHVDFHSGHNRTWASTARFVIMQAGPQSGKTCFGPHWLKREMDWSGAGDYLVVTATYPLLRMKLLPEMVKVFVDFFKWGTYRAGDKIFESHERDHGGPAQRIIIGSAKNPESLESATAKAAWCDEIAQAQFTREAWDAILRRLSISEGRVLATTTLYNFGWYKRDIYDQWRKGNKDYDIIQFDSTENPAFSITEWERAKASLPLWKFNMMYRGRFERPMGQIYDSFSEDSIISRFTIDPSWPRYVGHDFGPQNTAALWYAQDPATGFFYLYREYLQGGLSSYDHAQRFKALSGDEQIIRRVGGIHAEQGWRDAFVAAGWPIILPRMREVESGINRVYGWHQQSKLFIFDDMERYLEEKFSYSWRLDDDNNPTGDIVNKSSYHLMDAERYLMADFSPEMVENTTETRVVRNWDEPSGRLDHRRNRLRSRRRARAGAR